ncbi:Membrane-associated enzyme, PAP2 (acid phosphatase) superfamily [Pseudoxanthomonas sp. GM95]|uniref:phosphatase PAP2 family protein n=1 Tax=Pseudoxanthomonas sp. GM95 TaxID=1881043 RepID=UPI0008D6A2F3|nr:phosphatase PAP2 family protein [Pseudoxanthomonas sp. GM95]SEM46175.1 Membrane-associated enzyme, PAP2 (acid phosphatase) superfamily [Pseudoxanthomonas sp. GM95]
MQIPALARSRTLAAPRLRFDPLLWGPLCAMAAAIALLQGAGGDLWLADRLYAAEGGRWALEHHWVTETLVHQWGKHLDIVAWVAMAIARIVLSRYPAARAWWKPLNYLLVATLAGPLLVSWMKSWTDVDCPWDLTRYGGLHPYVELFQHRPSGYGPGQCFPAGHSSAGYGWVALFFGLGTIKPRWGWIGLGAGISVGLVFGISQQLRGAHFLSHDVASVAVCWCAAWCVQRLMLSGQGEDRA